MSWMSPTSNLEARISTGLSCTSSESDRFVAGYPENTLMLRESKRHSRAAKNAEEARGNTGLRQMVHMIPASAEESASGEEDGLFASALVLDPTFRKGPAFPKDCPPVVATASGSGHCGDRTYPPTLYCPSNGRECAGKPEVTKETPANHCAGDFIESSES